MIHLNAPPPISAFGATDTPALDELDDSDRKFCDGGVLLAAIKDSICPMCGVSPDDECGYEPGPLAVI